MTGNAILEVANAFLQMFGLDLDRVVFVTAIAGIGRKIIGVTGRAGNRPARFAAVIQRKGMLPIELRGTPCGCGMTGGAIGPELSRVERGIGVAVDARRRRSFEDPVLMAVLAPYVRMRAGQRKDTLRVVERGVLPIVRRVTLAAVLSKAAVVFIVFRVAGVTIRWRAFENAVSMTILAFRFDMSALQFEGRQVVIEVSRLPGFGGMARAAIRSKLSLMRIVLPMAGETVRRRGLEIRKSAGIDVTANAFSLDVLSNQAEGKVVVRKGLAEAIHAVVTGHAVPAIVCGVRLREGRVRLPMAVRTDGQVEGRDAVWMAIRADKRLARALRQAQGGVFELVTGQ